MKVALPSRNNNIDDHFGHCEFFSVYTFDLNTKTVLNIEVVESPNGCGCKSNIGATLAQKGVTLMLAGNMGNGAVNNLKSAGIEVIRGCSGELENVAQAYLNGELTDSTISCTSHECH